MSCTVKIDGTAVEVVKGSINVADQIGERSTASFVIVDTAGTGSYVRGNTVEIYDLADDLYFAGFIGIPEKVRMGKSGLIHPITCIDNHYLADKRLVIKSYANQTLAYIVTDIWTDYLDAEGITIGEVQTGPVIVEAIFNYVKASECFNALEELTGYIWYIDKNKKLYFIARDTTAAAWDLDGVTRRPSKGSVHLDESNPQYRTKQYIRGGTGTTAEQTENFTGDAATVAFTVGYPVALEPTVSVDAAGKTVGIKGIDTGKDCYWNKGDATVTFDTAPANATAVSIVYYGQYPMISVAADDLAQAARAAIEGGTGITEEIVTEAQHITAAAIRESASSKLLRYCQESERFTYTTTDSGLAPGVLQKITYSPFGFSEHEMLIEKIEMNAVVDTIYYTVTAITGPSVGSWEKFFSDILVRQDKAIKIGDSLLLVLFQQKEVLNLSESTDINSDDFTTTELVNRWIQLPPTTSEGCNVQHEKLNLAESVVVTDHVTEDYDWDDADMLWDFFTWG